jgi:hypothetical protein
MVTESYIIETHVIYTQTTSYKIPGYIFECERFYLSYREFDYRDSEPTTTTIETRTVSLPSEAPFFSFQLLLTAASSKSRLVSFFSSRTFGFHLLLALGRR